MRRLLLVPAFAFLLIGTPVLALQEPTPPTATVEDVPLSTASEPAPATPSDTEPSAPTTTTTPPEPVPEPTAETPAEPGWQSEATPVDSSMVGVKWEGDTAASFTVEAQASDGTWSPAAELDKSDLGADEGTADAASSAAAAAAANATEPVWIGPDATAVRVTLDDGTAADVTIAAVVESDGTTPGGAAGALSDVVGPLHGSDKWLFAGAVALIAALLFALALGWTPWRSRHRLRMVALAVCALALAACVPATPPPPPATGANGYPPEPAMVSRPAWGARPFDTAACGPPALASSLKFAVVHHTVNSNNYGPAQSAGIMRSTQAYHMDALGYCDIAYNFLVDRYGQIFEGRAGGASQPVIGGHTGGFNTQSTGVAMIGDFTSAQPPGEQFNAVINLLRWRMSIARIDPSQPFSTSVFSSPCGCVRWAPGEIAYFAVAILGHRDFDFTACPGNAFYPRMAELRSGVQAGIRIPPLPTPTTTPPTTTPPTT